MEEPNYVCLLGGKYLGRDDKGKFIEQYIPCGNKVYLQFNIGFVNIDYNNPCELRPHCINNDFPHVEKFCRCVIDDSGTEIYLKQENILNSFRPIIHKHIATIVFDTVEEMNKWLIDKPVNSIKDIKINCKVFAVMYLVTYIDNGDD